MSGSADSARPRDSRSAGRDDKLSGTESSSRERSASFGLFKDKAGADESVALAAEFVRTHMSRLLRQKPEIIEGSLKAHS